MTSGPLRVRGIGGQAAERDAALRIARAAAEELWARGIDQWREYGDGDGSLGASLAAGGLAALG